ncbi:hypothetical protein AHAS_Ahas20G0143400 [Arachis hypogaea]
MELEMKMTWLNIVACFYLFILVTISCFIGIFYISTFLQIVSDIMIARYYKLIVV